MKDDNVVEFKIPEDVHHKHDMLSEVIRSNAKHLLAAAVEIEVANFIKEHQQTLEDGRSRLVRNGYLPDREITTGIGPIEAKVPRVRDREGKGGNKTRFNPVLFPGIYVAAAT